MATNPECHMTPAMALLVIAMAFLLLLITTGGVLQVGPLRRAPALVYPSFDAIRVLQVGRDKISPVVPNEVGSGGAPCPESRRGHAIVLLLLPLVFPLQMLNGVRDKRRRDVTRPTGDLPR